MDDSQDQNEEGDDEKKQMVIEVEDEIQVKRKTGNLDAIINNEEKEKYQKKKIVLKFWNFYFQNVKKMWRNYY